MQIYNQHNAQPINKETLNDIYFISPPIQIAPDICIFWWQRISGKILVNIVKAENKSKQRRL